MTGLAILDLGYGNTRSVALAFERLGVSPSLTASPQEAEAADRLVLPGVGAAGAAMIRLRETGLDKVLKARTKPTLGICLGMQLLFERSEEDGGIDLLGMLPGDVRKLVATPGYPVPHMGWSRLDRVAEGQGLDDGDYVYFAHGFACPDGESVSAIAAYGEITIPVSIQKGSLWGAQFHPERSSATGSRYLEAFLSS